MELDGIDPIAAIGGIAGGLLATMISMQMMGNNGFGLFVKFLTFAVSSVVCYMMTAKILDR